jgi:hypothetical protein
MAQELPDLTADLLAELESQAQLIGEADGVSYRILQKLIEGDETPADTPRSLLRSQKALEPDKLPSQPGNLPLVLHGSDDFRGMTNWNDDAILPAKPIQDAVPNRE